MAGNGYYVYVNNEERKKIAAFLGITLVWLKRRYLISLPEEGWVVAIKDDETCLFLDEQKRCTIYSVRPEQCVTYPYWPEVVLRQRDWIREGKRCEGLGQGKVVSKKMVETMLEMQGWEGD